MEWIVPAMDCVGSLGHPLTRHRHDLHTPFELRGIRTAEPLGPIAVIDRHACHAGKEASAMSTLEIHLLGEFRLVYVGTPVNQLTAPRLQALLANLVLHRDAPQPRQRLAFGLWPESSEAQARTNLRQLVHALRQTLPDADHFVHVTAHTLQWRADAPCRLDVADFEVALDRAQAAERQENAHALRVALEQACAIYQGDLLPSCYDDWILPEREQLRQAYANALERLVAFLESQDQPRAALKYARHLVRHDPLREEAYRGLMRLHAACGDRAGVRRVYQTCAAVLERELGVESSAATREAYEHSVRLDAPTRPLPSSPPLTNTNLPVQLTSFVGRERELAELKPLLQTTRLLTLTGPGGTGKTRLALRLAAEVLETYAAGVWLVELAPLADPTLVAHTMATTLGVREQPGRPLLDALLDYLRAKRLLLLLDNCEHLIETCAHLAETLLRGAPSVRLLASSREALGIAGETAHRVPPLSLPDPRQSHDLAALAQNDSVRLFVERAAAAYPPFRLTAHNAPAIAQIVRRLDGIPLAIELAAARTKVFPPEQIAARLDDRFRLLTGGRRTALPRHQTLLALIEWSHQLLTAAERVLLRRLAVFAGSFSLEAAQAVGGAGLDAAGELGEVLDTLVRLADKSLVDVEEPLEAVEGRFRLLETIRQYARDKLLEAGEAEQARDRHLAFFLQVAEETEPKLRSAEQLAWLERVERDHDNLRAALAWALERGASERALRLAGALYYFWEFRGYWSEGQNWLDEALALSERERSRRTAAEVYPPSGAERAQRAKALYGAGRLHFAARIEPDVSRAMVEESLRLWRELGDTWWMAVALEHVGFMLRLEGDLQTARARLEEGASLAREVTDRWPLALCLVRLATDATFTDVAAAHRIRAEAVRLARSVGDKSVLCQALTGMAGTYFVEGNLAAAAAVAEEARVEARAIRSVTHVFLSLLELVITACLQADLTKAKKYCVELQALARETGSLTVYLVMVFAFGILASFSGQPQRAVRLLAATDAFARQRGSKVSFGKIFIVGDQALEMARAQLDPATFEAAWTEGQQMTEDQLVALATEDERTDAPVPEA
jgi:predicted ATPase/DNA-binding SARP family transcriptional activator